MKPKYTDWTLALYQALIENRPSDEASIYRSIPT